MATATHIRPFSCGTQFADWQESNCCKCEKYDYDEDAAVEVCDCPILEALSLACFGDGEVTQDIADRMGYTKYGWAGDLPRYGWPCLEHQPEFSNLKEWEARQ